MKKEHEKRKQEYDTCTAVSNILKNQIVDAIKGPYLRELRERRFGYLNTTPMDMLDHLFDRYGNLTAIDIQESKTRFNEPFNPDDPIAVYFQKLEDEQQVSADGGVPVSHEMLMQTALFAFYTSGIFIDACKRWEDMAPANKTWTNLKTHFSAEYKSYKSQQKINAQQGGYHSANAVTSENTTTELADALDHLANAAVSDKTTMTNLTNQITDLIRQNQMLIEQNGLLLKTMANMSMATTAMQSPQNYHTQAWLQETKSTYNKTKDKDPQGYCWSHGYNVAVGHNSNTCHKRKKGHKSNATRQNTMGGCQDGK